MAEASKQHGPPYTGLNVRYRPAGEEKLLAVIQLLRHPNCIENPYYRTNPPVESSLKPLNCSSVCELVLTLCLRNINFISRRLCILATKVGNVLSIDSGTYGKSKARSAPICFSSKSPQEPSTLLVGYPEDPKSARSLSLSLSLFLILLV